MATTRGNGPFAQTFRESGQRMVRDAKNRDSDAVAVAVARGRLAPPTVIHAREVADEPDESEVSKEP